MEEKLADHFSEAGLVHLYGEEGTEVEGGDRVTYADPRHANATTHFVS